MSFTTQWAQKQGEELLVSGQFSDVTLAIEYEDQPSREIRAHRCILHLLSPVWSSVVNWTNNPERVVISQFPYEIIIIIIKFAYTREMKIENMACCVGIMRAIDFYDMKDAVQYCETFVRQYLIKGRVEMGEMADLINITYEIKFEKMKTYCLAFLEDYTNRFLNSPEFLSLTYDVVLTILKLQHYLCPEDFLIRSCLRWCDANRGDMDLIQYVHQCDFLKHFRWVALSTAEKESLLSAYHGLFPGEFHVTMFHDPILAAKARRGEPSGHQVHCINVRRPPYILRETFTYYGQPMVLPFNSIGIPTRFNSVEEGISSSFEDSITVSVFDHSAEFDGVVPASCGAVAIFEPPLLVPLVDQMSFLITITFHKPGTYYKNTNFTTYRQGLYRYEGGIVQKINDSETNPFSNIQPIEQ